MLQTDTDEESIRRRFKYSRKLKLERAELLQGVLQAEDCKTDKGPGNKASPNL